MIKSIEMFTVVCDNCGKSADEGTDYAGWNDKEYAKDIAMEANWVNENDKHFCTNCYEYDDDYNLIIKEYESKRKPKQQNQ